MYWIAFGDIHESTSVLAEIPELAGAEGVIITGDLTNHGTPSAIKGVIGAVEAYNRTILAQPGNMDTEAVARHLDDLGINLHLQIRRLAPGLGIMGIGHSTPTPFGTPGEVPESTIEQWLEECFERAESMRFDTLILAIHEPPANTRLDMIGNGQHVGSPVVRRFIEEKQPALVLTGHIHESRGTDTIGASTVINPGMLAGGGYVRLDYIGGRLTAQLKNV
ncbi:metallophosphoesterase family protein [Salidesulfovibrio onnuriiensis]|uniref:metallophosphoesterase family protein n=1 Tax=Salidesulfovibrio onnuriiensis TaxID=2583823 RepID=UPI0011C89DAD|nr:metallophosphoesterase [Salidesulfovibrio onnuriiensis]